MLFLNYIFGRSSKIVLRESYCKEFSTIYLQESADRELHRMQRDFPSIKVLISFS